MFIKIFTLSLMVLFTSCKTTKETLQDSNNNKMSIEQSDNKVMDTQMLTDGFQIGEIKHLKDSECEYVIIDKATNAKFDPINITEAVFKDFKKDTLKIYYKYRPLRRMNRCPDANPVELIEIKKREG
jgi:hypothetical protein